MSQNASLRFPGNKSVSFLEIQLKFYEKSQRFENCSKWPLVFFQSKCFFLNNEIISEHPRKNFSKSKGSGLRFFSLEEKVGQKVNCLETFCENECSFSSLRFSSRSGNVYFSRNIPLKLFENFCETSNFWQIRNV